MSYSKSVDRYSRTSPSIDECAVESITVDSVVSILVAFLQPYSSTLPKTVQDFCIPNTGIATCKNSSAATVEDFVFSGIKFPGKFSETGLAARPVNVNIFPGLNTLGMSFVRADFEVGGINVPHFHPRATEIAFVLEGRVY
ncbi:hypothetical protein CRYUN_Cryun01aG0076900 [Craigia yunnanensis]